MAKRPQTVLPMTCVTYIENFKESALMRNLGKSLMLVKMCPDQR